MKPIPASAPDRKGAASVSDRENGPPMLPMPPASDRKGPSALPAPGTTRAPGPAGAFIPPAPAPGTETPPAPSASPARAPAAFPAGRAGAGVVEERSERIVEKRGAAAPATALPDAPGAGSLFVGAGSGVREEGGRDSGAASVRSEAFASGGFRKAGEAGAAGPTGSARAAECAPDVLPVPDALPEDVPLPFVLLDAVEEAGPERLVALRRFAASPVWQALEAAAQAAALHQRFLAGFARHAFLLSVDACRFPADAPDGPYRIRASLLGQSSRAASYRVELEPVRSAREGAFPVPASETDASERAFRGLQGHDPVPNPGLAHSGAFPVPGSGGDVPSGHGVEAHPGGSGTPGGESAGRCGMEGHAGGLAGHGGDAESRSGMEPGSGDGTHPGGDAARPRIEGRPGGDPVRLEAGSGGFAYPGGSARSDMNGDSACDSASIEAHPDDAPADAGGDWDGAASAAWSVDLGVGLADYGGAFRRELLEPRYRRLFQWLTKHNPCATVSRSD